MKKKLLNFLPYIIFLTASFLPFLIYGNHVINSPYVSDRQFHFQQYFETWSHANKGGFNYFFIPFDIMIFFLMKVFPQAIVIEFSDAVIIFLAFVTSFKLANFLFRDKLIGLLTAFVYTYSIYGQFVSNWTVASGSIVFALAPLFTYILFSTDEKTNEIRQGVILGLCTLLFIDVNITFIVYLYLFLGSIMFYRFFFESRIIGRKLFLTIIISIVCFIGINSVMFITFFAENHNQALLSKSLSAETVDWKSSTSYLHELFREMGALDFYFSFLGNYSYPNAQIYQTNPFVIIISYIFPLLAFLSILINSKTKELHKRMLFFLILIIFILFFAMGVFLLSPTKFIYRFLEEHIVYFSIFRDSYKVMFLLNLIYAVLIGYLFVYIKQFHSKYFKQSVYILLCLIFINTFPFWTGSFLKQEIITIPDYWYSFSSFYRNIDGKNNILFMPSLPFPVYTFTATRIKATTFYRPLVNDNQISNIDIVSAFTNETLAFVYKQYSQPEFPALLGFYSIPSVLVQQDVDWKAYKAKNPEIVKKALDKNFKNSILFR